MRHLAAGRLGQLPVLVCGRGDVMSVAAGYGFKQIMHTSQLAAASPGALPFEDKGHQVTGVMNLASWPCSSVLGQPPDTCRACMHHWWVVGPTSRKLQCLVSCGFDYFCILTSQ